MNADETEVLKKLRLEKGWSQEQLADISGVSVRTIQRLEKGEKPGMESLKALAAAFDIPTNQLQKKINDKPEHASMKSESKLADNIASYGWKGLLIHLGSFMVFVTWLLFLVNQFGVDEEIVGVIGILWGGGLLSHFSYLVSSDN
jgi:transcriptional regulator with XRE-family HTH domain